MLKANSKIKYMDRTWYPGQEISDVPQAQAMKWLMTGEAVGTLPNPELAEGGTPQGGDAEVLQTGNMPENAMPEPETAHSGDDGKGLENPGDSRQEQEPEVDLQKLEIGELRKMAKEAGVTVPRNAKKTELITILGGGQA